MFHPVCSLVTGTLTNTKNLPCDALKIRQPFSNVFEETSYEVSPSANLLALHVRRAACRGLPFVTFGGATASAFPHSPRLFLAVFPMRLSFPSVRLLSPLPSLPVWFLTTRTRALNVARRLLSTRSFLKSPFLSFLRMAFLQIVPLPSLSRVVKVSRVNLILFFCIVNRFFQARRPFVCVLGNLSWRNLERP